MIRIKERDGGNYIILSSVSDFSDSMGYCEFRIKHFLKGIKPPQTKITLEGTISHEKEVEHEKEHFEFVPLTRKELEDINEHLEFPREGIYTRLLTTERYGNRKLHVLIVGQADKISRSKGMLIVEESKYPENTEKYLEKFEPFEDQTIQALLYLNSRFSNNDSVDPKEWFEIPHRKKVWIINIKNKATRKSVKVFKGIQTREATHFLREKISRFALIVLGAVEPEHHRSIRKCMTCRLFNYCEYKITNS